MTKKSDTDVEAALDFLHALFGENRTQHKIFLCTLANDDSDPSQPRSRELTTRDTKLAANFIAGWDKPGRGMFFSVGTTNTRRTKDEILETIGLHCDIDFNKVDATADEIEHAIGRLKRKPTVRVNSGHGIHLYWLFEMALETQPGRERVEELLRLLCEHVAGDTQVCEISRLMRLPGTHNTKFDSWVPVTCVYSDGPRYNLFQLGEWLGTQVQPMLKPLLRRRPVSSVGGAPHSSADDDNPFVRAAHEYGYHQPIDIDARIAAMDWHGEGEAGINATRRDVAASMHMRGATIEEVIAKLLPAIMALSAKHGQRWAERAERKLIEREFASAAKKFTRDEAVEEPIPQPGPDGWTKATKPPKMPPPPPPGGGPGGPGAGGGPSGPKSKVAHVVLAKGVLKALEQRGEQILITPTSAYWYLEGLWYLLDDRELQLRLNREITIGARALGLVTNKRLCSEAQAWILREPELFRPDTVFDAHGKIPVINGLIDPKTGKLEPPAPEHYATWRIEHGYDRKAKCPLWIQMLRDVLGDRDEDAQRTYIELIQELLGVGLIDRRGKGLRRALIFRGNNDTGKSKLLDVLGGLFDRINATPIDTLDGTHGLMPFRERAPWVLHEAFNEGEWHKSAIVKAIVSGDTFNINVKNAAIASHRFNAPIFWASNHDAAFKEITRAVAERIVIIECRQTFSQSEPTGVAAIAAEKGYASPADLVLDTEMPGVLAWAIAGLERALKRGSLVIPQESLDAIEAVHMESNFMLGFMRQCRGESFGMRILVGDLNAAVRAWYQDQLGGDAARLSAKRIHRALVALGDRTLVPHNDELRDKGNRYHCCIELNKEGLDYWEDWTNSFSGKGKTNVSSGRGDVTQILPPAWEDKPSIKKARLAQKRDDRSGDRSAAGDRSNCHQPMTDDRSDDGVTDHLSPKKSKFPRF